jgi:hypothetical protein
MSSVLAILTGGAGGYLNVGAIEYLADARSPINASVSRT